MTFTVEHVFKETVVTVLDDSGRLEDVEWMFDEEGVMIRQWNNELGTYDLVEMNHQQLREALKAMGLPEGTYTAR